MLEFRGGAADKVDADGMYRVGWTGPWPPPEKMLVAVGRQTGLAKVTEPATLNIPMDELEAVAHVTVYRRDSASVLPDDFDSPHVFRGAVYVTE